MGHLKGLKEYLDEKYNISIFDQALESGHTWRLHLHNHLVIEAKVIQNLQYDIQVLAQEKGEELLPKLHVKFLYPETLSESVLPLIKTDRKVTDLGLEPIPSPSGRYHIKNKTIFPLMEESRPVFFTLLEGDVIKGIIADFSRYEITVNLKGGIPVTILRHSVYDLKDKKGRCFLKSFQETSRDWEKSDLYVSSPTDNQPLQA
jgi:hypothetical protein